jgi:PAS domain S-box-containing protein
MPMREVAFSVFDAAVVRWLDERAVGGILTTDRDLVIRGWNTWLERVTGQPSSTVLGQHLFAVRPEIAERGLDRYYQSALEGQSSMLAQRFHGYLLRIPTPAGDMAQSCRVAPLLHANAIIGTVTVIEDVSDRVNTENELRRQIGVAERARAEAESALRAKDEFLATLSHELRTPLNAVLGWTNILLNGNTKGAMRERALRVIERNATAQARLIDDMLDMARIVTGKIRLELSVVDVVAATAAAIDVVRPTASAKRISLNAEFGPTPKLIHADGARLQQVVWNVLANAVKFTPTDGRIDVRVLEKDDAVQIVVRDTGRGITAEFLPFVFDRFRQGNSSMTRSEGGLGLGLALVRQLVDLHGGEVQVASEGVGHGTTFTIAFPAIGHDDAPLLAERPVRLAPSSLAGRHVLLVDDEQDWREALCTTLEALGARVNAVGTAAEAIAVVTAPMPTPLTALVLDVGLPETDGYSLLKQIRALGGPVARTPALAVTAYSDSQHRQIASEAGFDGFCSKPISPEEVAATILTLTRAHGSSD